MSYVEYMMTQTTIGREIFFNLMTREVDKNAKGFYPAPYEIMGVLKDNFQKPEIEWLKDEAKRFAKLAATPQSEALVGIFQGTSAVKKHSFGAPSHPINTIAVLGAGLMGAGIATVSVDNGGYRVLLKDKDLAGVSRGEKIISDSLAVKVTRKSMTDSAFAEKTSRLIPLHDDIASWKTHFSKADLVIEGQWTSYGTVCHFVTDHIDHKYDLIPSFDLSMLRLHFRVFSCVRRDRCEAQGAERNGRSHSIPLHIRYKHLCHSDRKDC